ncbi:MAG: hypothetical protein GKS07_09055 [Nitrosopumilus sp.]|nr:MAG: hypothetical protein GKS07_09055 [Nitrosopumilus sp.]
MVPNQSNYRINKWMIVIFGLAIMVSVIIFYLPNGPLNTHIPFYEQMDCKSLGNLILDQGSFDEMLRYYEKTCTGDTLHALIFGK